MKQQILLIVTIGLLIFDLWLLAGLYQRGEEDFTDSGVGCIYDCLSSE